MRRHATTLAAAAVMFALATPALAADPHGSNPANDQAIDRGGTAPDNTGRNERDRGGTLTPMDQSESEGDRTITQTIRKRIVNHEDMSTNAKNVKVITIDGVVTLRGPVNNSEERTTIGSIAKETPGVKRVDNQLEITHKKKGG